MQCYLQLRMENLVLKVPVGQENSSTHQHCLKLCVPMLGEPGLDFHHDQAS